MTKHLGLVALLWLMAPSSPGVTAYAAAPEDDTAQIRQLLNKFEDAVRLADASAFLNLLTPSADRDRAAEFCKGEFPQSATRVVIQERERNVLPGADPETGRRLIVDGFF